MSLIRKRLQNPAVFQFDPTNQQLEWDARFYIYGFAVDPSYRNIKQPLPQNAILILLRRGKPASDLHDRVFSHHINILGLESMSPAVSDAKSSLSDRDLLEQLIRIQYLHLKPVGKPPYYRIGPYHCTYDVTLTAASSTKTQAVFTLSKRTRRLLISDVQSAPLSMTLKAADISRARSQTKRKEFTDSHDKKGEHCSSA